MIPSRPVGRVNTGETVAHNLLWNVVELVSIIITMLIVNIWMARAIGPRPLGYFNLVFWITSISGRVGSLGLPATTGKYMAEYIAADKKALARAVFFYSLRLQAAVSGLLTVLGVIIVFAKVNQEFRISSIFLVLSLLPAITALIPSQANNARENVRANLPGSLTGSIIQVAVVVASLTAGWGLVGVAIGVFLSSTAEMTVKLVVVLRWLKHYERGLLSPDIKRRLLGFSGFSTAVMLVQVILWDRSDVVLLKVLQPDIRQITFFSIAFGLADRLLRIPQTIGNAIALTQLAEYGRNRERLSRITAASAKYIFTVAVPLLLIAAAMSAPSIRTMYGKQYVAVIPVFVLTAILSIPKSVITPAQTMLLSTEDMGFLVVWSCLCGALNIGLDCLLIPKHGAAGAAIGNGFGQLLAAAGIWFRVVKYHNVALDWSAFARASAAAVFTAATVYLGAHLPFSPMLQFAASGVVAAVTLPITLRIFHVLTTADVERARTLLRRLPLLVQDCLIFVVDWTVVDSPELVN